MVSTASVIGQRPGVSPGRVSYADLRDYLRIVEEMGDLQRIKGVDPNLELGAITELMAERDGPALLFDEIQGYKRGYRVAVNVFVPPRRAALLFGLNPDQSHLSMVSDWRSRMKTYSPVPPLEVKHGPTQGC